MKWSNGLSPGGRVRIEQAAFPAGGHRHPHRRGQALPQRAGGDLHTLGVMELRMPRSQRNPRPQSLQILQFQTEPPEVELDVEGQAGVPTRQHEPVPAGPVNVFGVVPHHPLKQRVDQRAKLIAVPGCPLPTFCTASAANTRTVSTARLYRSVQSLGT